MNEILDVLIVGGGPAGLSAALILGRCRRRILVCDAKRYRNQASWVMHGYLGRDGISPADFLNISHNDLKSYSNVECCYIEVAHVRRVKGHFKARLGDGRDVFAKKGLLATGISDEIPNIPQIREFFGKSIFLCPYCDGWEFRDKPVAVYGAKGKGPRFALLMRQWTTRLVLCTNGEVVGTPQEVARLKELKVEVITERILHLEGHDGQLERVVFENNVTTEADALFFNTPIHANNRLAQTMGCHMNERGEIEVNACGLSSVPGVYVAGDVSPDIKLVIVAAAEGAKAACSLNKELLNEEIL